VGSRAYFADALSAYQRALTVPGSFAPQRLAEIEVRVAACQKETVKPC